MFAISGSIERENASCKLHHGYGSDIEKLFKGFGADISEGNGSRARIELNGVKAVFHRPHPHKEILWKDCDWDSRYLYIIMRSKITRMRKLLERCKVHCSHADNIRHMKIVEELLDFNKEATSSSVKLFLRR